MTPEYLSPDDVAAVLGVNRKTVYAAIDDGRLPALRVGRVLRVARADLDVLAVRATGRVAPAGASPRPRGVSGEFARRARGV